MVRKCGLLLGLALAVSPTGVHAQEPLVIAGISLGFAWLTPTPTPLVSTVRPTPRPSTATPTFRPITATLTSAPVVTPATDVPTPTTKHLATAAPITVTPGPATMHPTTTTVAPKATHEEIDSPSSEDATAVTGTSTQPTVEPKPSSPAPAPSTTAVTPAPAPTTSHNCDEATTSLITKFYENNDVLEGDCAAANNYYRFPFEGVPSRAQLLNMSKTAACTVLMQALLQIVPKECDFKRIALRSTAEAILQLAKNMKKNGENVVLPSEEAITQAIEARRQKLLNSGGSKAVDGGVMTASTSKTDTSSKAPTASGTTASSSSSGSDWTITDGITNVDDDGKHVLLAQDLLVVGTWSDNPESPTGDAPSVTRTPVTTQPSPALLDTKIQSTSASDSLQLIALSVQAALVLVWVFVQ